MIEARGLVKRYGSTIAVDNLSFDVMPGTVTGFLGPNGAGKSTTMRMMLGLDRPDAGHYWLDGREVGTLSDEELTAVRRDLIGFVDGTENPVDQAALNATIIGEEDATFAGGSYVIVQKYLHNLNGWNALPIEEQERIIGRTKLSNIELDDAVKPTSAHNALTTIIEDGEQLEIVRDNMPFGDVGKGEFGTYFIGYARSPRRIEQMLENMFVGRPPGNYDRLLDFSRAVTGTLFFVPSTTFLDNVAPESVSPAIGMQTPQEPEEADKPPSRSSPSDGSLGIGSLKKEAGYE